MAQPTCIACYIQTVCFSKSNVRRSEGLWAHRQLVRPHAARADPLTIVGAARTGALRQWRCAMQQACLSGDSEHSLRVWMLHLHECMLPASWMAAVGAPQRVQPHVECHSAKHDAGLSSRRLHAGLASERPFLAGLEAIPAWGRQLTIAGIGSAAIGRAAATVAAGPIAATVVRAASSSSIATVPMGRRGRTTVVARWRRRGPVANAIAATARPRCSAVWCLVC
mmetsp:Transcript_32613/g.97324  ORF Transcript_32613/g.97324 Transcript_32613/m.97324 type:complete len:224 (-) Transcript_32613:714-1385(-)